MGHDAIELRHLRYFKAVAEEQSFTGAAQRLHLAQPALSQQIRQLEERLGVRLLERVPRVALTPAGASLLESAQRILRDVQLAAETAARVAAGQRAVLDVAIASSAALTRLPSVIKEFCNAHPEADVRLHEMHSAEQVDALKRGALDLAVMREPTTEASLTSVELVREPFVLVLPPRHPLLRYRAPALGRCASDAFVLFPRRVAPALFDQIQTICREAGFSPRVASEASEWHTIVALVAAGMGISIAPASVASLRVRGASVRALRSTAGRAVLYLCFHETPRSPTARVLARFIQRRMHLQS
jgi:DNA-binding transcriptional LysR family regulator